MKDEEILSTCLGLARMIVECRHEPGFTRGGYCLNCGASYSGTGHWHLTALGRRAVELVKAIDAQPRRMPAREQRCPCGGVFVVQCNKCGLIEAEYEEIQPRRLPR